MFGFRGRTGMMLCMLVAGGTVWAQSAPPAPDHPWDSTVVKQPFKLPPQVGLAVAMDPAKLYTLPELIDIAEHNNPDTRVAWENAKARAGDLGISKVDAVSDDGGGFARGQRARGDILWALLCSPDGGGLHAPLHSGLLHLRPAALAGDLDQPEQSAGGQFSIQ